MNQKVRLGNSAKQSRRYVPTTQLWWPRCRLLPSLFTNCRATFIGASSPVACPFTPGTSGAGLFMTANLYSSDRRRLSSRACESDVDARMATLPAKFIWQTLGIDEKSPDRRVYVSLAVKPATLQNLPNSEGHWGCKGTPSSRKLPNNSIQAHASRCLIYLTAIVLSMQNDPRRRAKPQDRFDRQHKPVLIMLYKYVSKAK